MIIRPVDQVLAPLALSAPVLDALIPNADNYRAFMVQPHGIIEADAGGVRHRMSNAASSQFQHFLHKASLLQPELVITPEYSLPWQVLVESITAGRTPSKGKLWALGCESIKYQELQQLQQTLAGRAHVIFEGLAPEPDRFADPLAFVFLSPTVADPNQHELVVLAQFKTQAMGDNDHLENNHLLRGSSVYQFGGTPANQIKLAALICSDAFAVTDAEVHQVYDRALLLHIQLNPQPRHTQYRLYRDKLLQLNGDTTELVCLNWARNVVEWSNGAPKPWNNIAGSAWYVKPKREFGDGDEAVCANHRRGLYYTWLRSLRTHALFFNYDPACFLVTASKVAHVGVPAALSRRSGPQLTAAFSWNDATNEWLERPQLEDEFSSIVTEADDATTELLRLANDSPLNAERAMALSVGEVRQGQDWYQVGKLDSCTIEATEVIRRITFCQDRDAEARSFRVGRLKQCGRLYRILRDGNRLPRALFDLAGGFQFSWSFDHPHQNVVGGDGRATVVYLGEDASDREIEETARRLTEYLRISIANDDERLTAQHRLAVCYRNNRDEVAVYQLPHLFRFDRDTSASEFDIGRDEG